MAAAWGVEMKEVLHWPRVRASSRTPPSVMKAATSGRGAHQQQEPRRLDVRQAWDLVKEARVDMQPFAQQQQF